MSHPIYKVESFAIAGTHTLLISFDDGTQRLVNFLPVLAGELLGPLRDARLFNQVALDPEVHTLVWPNGADFDPATLHDWPTVLPQAVDESSRPVPSMVREKK